VFVLFLSKLLLHLTLVRNLCLKNYIYIYIYIYIYKTVSVLLSFEKDNLLLDEVESLNFDRLTEGPLKSKGKIRHPENFNPGGLKWGMEYYFVYLFRKANPLLDEVES
jgi:hypothetical protein